MISPQENVTIHLGNSHQGPTASHVAIKGCDLEGDDLLKVISCPCSNFHPLCSKKLELTKVGHTY